MKSGRYTIRELLNEGDVDYFCVPEIQRDYVWKEEQVRPFLEGIINSRERPHPLLDCIPEIHRQSYATYLAQANRYNIGFIYAYFDKTIPERFFLIDGQQRLTTLYVFMAVLASMDAEVGNVFRSRYFKTHNEMDQSKIVPDFRSFQLKIDYKVREVAHTVLQHLIADLAFATKQSHDYMVKLLHGQWDWNDSIRPDWWQMRFESDRTVQNLFDNVALIASIVSANSNDSHIDVRGIFQHIEESVEVWYFDTSLAQQGEELYVYMNSRGEQLSYNENRRAACLALCKPDERGNIGQQWDTELQNSYWLRRGNNPSADKGLDLFLQTVDLMHEILQNDDKNAADLWPAFIDKNECLDTIATKDLLRDYFDYQKAVEFLLALPEQERPLGFSGFLHGTWKESGNEAPQRNAILVLTCFELLKGSEINAHQLEKFHNCRLFFENLGRHYAVQRNPRRYVTCFLQLANECRAKDLDILKLLPASESEKTNILLTPEERWRLQLLANRHRSFGEKDMGQMLNLLDEISKPKECELDVLMGEVTVLFAVAFDGDENSILTHCAKLSFAELKQQLQKAKSVFCNNFSMKVITETARKLLLYGDYQKIEDRTWYPYSITLIPKAKDLAPEWHARIQNPKGEYSRVNGTIVRFLRAGGLPPPKLADIGEECKILQWIAAKESIGPKLFQTIFEEGTLGRFKIYDGGKPEFKGRKTLVYFLSEAWRKGGISYNGTNLLINFYQKASATDFVITVSIPEKGDNGIEILLSTEEDWEKFELDNVIQHYRNTGELINPKTVM